MRLAERESGIMMMVPREFPPTGLSLAPRVNVNWATNEYPQYRPRSGRHVGHDHRYHHHLHEIGIIVFIIIDTTNVLSIYESFSDVPESRVCFASKNLTHCRMH